MILAEKKNRGRAVRANDWEIQGWMTYKTSVEESVWDRAGKELRAAKWSSTSFPYCSWSWPRNQCVHRMMGNYSNTCTDRHYVRMDCSAIHFAWVLDINIFRHHLKVLISGWVVDLISLLITYFTYDSSVIYVKVLFC